MNAARAALFSPLVVACAVSAQGLRDVKIESTKVVEGVYMLEGRGGNIGLCIGADGTFLIDDQFAPLTGMIIAEVATLTDQPIQFVVNTHWHGDHTGGNENLGKEGAIIVAHENVRERLTTEQFMERFDERVPPAHPDGVPVITFAESITFHLNGDDILVLHVPHAHTDGDSVILFDEANVVHMGDVFFNGMYPFIDYGSGGTIEGVIAAVDRVLGECDEGTKIIPGHGALTDTDGLRRYRTMLETIRGEIAAMIEAGKSRDEVVAAKPTAAFDERWGGGMFQADAWVELLYDGMARQ